MAAEGLCSLLPCVSPATKGFGAAAIRGGQEGVLRKIWSVRFWCEHLPWFQGQIWPGNIWKLCFISILPTLNHPKPTPLRFFLHLALCHVIILSFTSRSHILETPPVVFAASSDALWSCTIPTSIAPTIPPATLVVERHPPSNEGNASIVEMGKLESRSWSYESCYKNGNLFKDPLNSSQGGISILHW